MPTNSRPTDRSNRNGRARIYIAIDTESTGVEADQGEIIEIAVLRFRLEKGGQIQVLDEWQTFVRPQNPIPYKITNLTGIRQADVEHAPSFNQIREQLRQFLGNYPIIGHSVESDIGFLRRAQYEVLNPALDTYELATLLLPQQTNYSLKAVAETLGVESGSAHRALADARMTMEVFAGLVGRIEALPPEVVREVDRVAGELQGEWSLHRLFQTALEIQSEEEDSGGAVSNLGALLKLKLAEQQKSSPGKSDDLSFLYLSQEEAPVPLVARPLDPAIAAQLENRVSQPIWHAFEVGRNLLLEAPGGVVGSENERAQGILVAAVQKARQEGRSVILAVNGDGPRNRLLNEVIPSTQEHLSQLEHPEAVGKRRRNIEPSFKVATVKSQSNYLCLRRWESFRKMAHLTDDELKLVIKVLIWLPGTTEGDGSELRIGNSERLWSRINSQRGLCLPEFCNRPGQPQCFFYRAQERAKASHVVVADQGLILADLVGQAGTLPSTNWVIVDDAHHLEDEASRQLGIVITPYSLFNFLDWLSRPITWIAGVSGERNGFLHELPRFYKKDTDQGLKEVLGQLVEQAAHQVDLAREAAGTLLRDLGAILGQHNHDSGQADGRVRLDPKFRNGPAWAESVGVWENFHREWEELYYRLSDLRDEVLGAQFSLKKGDELESDLKYYVNQCNYLLNKLTAAFETGEGGQVFWMGNTRLHATSSAAQALASENEAAPLQERISVNIYSAPLEVGPILEQRLFERKESTALVSSTLTTENDFTFIKERLGLEHSQPLEVRLSAERNYGAGLLYLPSDMPEPNQPGYQKNIDQYIMEMVRQAKGRVVVIFTSNSAVRMTYKAVQRPLENTNILVLGQGMDGSRRSMMTRFHNTPRAVLLTTLGFWETTELSSGGQPNGQPNSQPNETEEETGLFDLLVITKLPFDPPTDPVFAARVESRLFDKPFEQYSLPRTILRFRQTFERLLAGQPERSAVVMLDSRLISKSYGSLFLHSLPPLTTHTDSLTQMGHQIEDWLKAQV